MNKTQTIFILGIITGLLLIVPLIEIINLCPYELIYPYDIDIEINYTMAGFAYDRYAWIIKEEYREYNLYAISNTIEIMVIKYLVFIIGFITIMYVLKNRGKVNELLQE